VYHDKEGDKGSFFAGQHIDSQNHLTNEKKHQINSYLKDVISSVNGADELYILAQQRQNQIRKKINAENRLFPANLNLLKRRQHDFKPDCGKVKQFYSQK
jgi:phage-related tail protein